MFFKVYCSSEIVKGDVLSYNSETELWEKANGISHPVCVAQENAILRDEDFNKYAVKGVFSGATVAKASRLIPPEGGELQIEAGGVYVDNTSKGEGLIFPQIIDNLNQRNVGDLVQVWVR